jgi:ABC-2 type transport system permease protein
VLVLVVGRLFYDVGFPASWLAFVFFTLLGVLVFSTIGIAFTVFIPNADSASAMVQMPFLVLQFASGVFFSIHDTPVALRWIANLFPLRWLLEGLRAGYLGLDFVHVTKAPDPDGSGSVYIPDTVDGFGAITSQWLGIAVMLAWFCAAALVALRHFRWERRAG